MVDHNTSNNNDQLRIDIIDVGQGDSILIEGQDGTTALIDSGPRHNHGEQVLEYLDKYDIDSIDHLIATHYDADHIGGHAAIVETFGPDRIGKIHGPAMDGVKSSESATMTRYQDALDEAEMEVNQLQEGDDFDLDGATVDVLNPSPAVETTDRNENSVVLQMTHEEQRVLLSSDVEGEAEAQLFEQYPDQLAAVDVVKAAHHGSKNGTGETSLDGTTPESMAISSSLTNRFTDTNEHDAHPHDAMLKRVHDHEGDIDLYWTPVHGTTNIFVGDDEIQFETDNERSVLSAADVAATKYYCRAHDLDAEDVELLLTDELPEDTPEWVAEAAPMVAANTEEMIDTAITNAETLADARQTLDDYPAATEQFRQTAKQHRDEHITLPVDVQENRQAYREANRVQAAAQPSRRERVRSKLPFVTDPDLPEYDGPAPDEIDGPFTEDDLPPSVTDRRTAASIRDEFGDESPPDYLVAAEEQANAAVNGAETIEKLCEGLRRTPGAHKEVINAMETPYTHLPDDMVPDERESARDRTADLSHDRDKGLSL